MTKEQLSESYCKATLMIQKETTELYEALHTNGGEPIDREDYVRHLCSQYLLKVRSELDMIKSARRETED